MRLLLTVAIIISFIFSGMAQSQDWRPVRADGTYMYYTGDEYRAIRIDSLSQQGDARVMYCFPELTMEDYACFNPYGPSWIGKKIIDYSDSTVFYNLYDEPVTLLQNPMPGKQWLMFYSKASDSIWAKALSRTVDNIGFGTDSIVTLQIISKGMYNNQLIKISKHFGLMLCPSFLSFPYTDQEYPLIPSFSLSGKDQVSSSVSNLTAFEVFNFEIGDEFHIKDYYAYFDYENYTSWTVRQIKIITGKEYNSDSSKVTYNYEGCSTNGSYTGTDEYVFANYWLDSLPYLFHRTDDGFNSGISMQHKSKYGPIEKVLGTGFAKTNDSCYSFIYIDKKMNQKKSELPIPFYEGEFIKGLGGPYYNHLFMLSTSSRELIYYKKGSTQWGTPYNCDSLVGISEKPLKYTANVYPNPASDYIQIDLTFVSKQTTLLVMDVMGKEILRIALPELKNPASIAKLPKGVYFYHIYNSGKSIKKGNFIKQ
jgi:hypothetical protein